MMIRGALLPISLGTSAIQTTMAQRVKKVIVLVYLLVALA